MKMVDSCKSCEGVFYCVYNNFESCPKIEIATAGLGVPYKPKDNNSYLSNIPFGVYMGLKHMRNGFALPSCTYNIELSQDDLRQLLDKGYIISTRPSAMDGIYKDEQGKVFDISGHCLAYSNEKGEQPVQFISICLENNN